MMTSQILTRGHDAAPPVAARLLFRMLEHLHSGSLEVVSPDGQSHAFPGKLPGTHAKLELRDWNVCADILKRGDIGFAEAYFNGRWDSENLTALLTLAAFNQGGHRARAARQLVVDAGLSHPPPPVAREHQNRQPPQHSCPL